MITGIPFNFEGSEKNLFKKNEDICDEIILQNDVTLYKQNLNIIEKK